MLRGFVANGRGNVAITFGLSLVPIMLTVGAAVDYARWSSSVTALRAHVDGIALAAIKNPQDPAALSSLEVALANRLTTINHNPTFDAVKVELVSQPTDLEAVVEVSAAGTLPAVIMKAFGFKNLPISASSEARRAPKTYEVSLIVDVTGSMRGSKINALRDAARGFVQTLLPEGSQADRILVNLVPYSSAVNIGRSRIDWLGALDIPPYGSHRHPDGTAQLANKYIWRATDPSAASGRDRRVDQPDCRGTNVTWNAALELCHIGALSVWTRPGPCPGIRRNGTCYVSDGWAGCVEERGRGNHDVTDATRATARFAPYYWPSWGEDGSVPPNSRYNSYLPNPVDESRATLANNNEGIGPNLGCPKDEITDWTNDRAYLLQQINQFEAWHRGGTLGHVGLVWGWRTLSPLWAGEWGPWDAPRPFDPTLVEKIAVFMTDGENGYYTGHSPPNDGDYTAYGRLLTNPGWTRANNRSHLNAKMLTVCQGMRDDGIEIFTVGFGVNSAAQTLLRECATSADHFFNANTSTIVQQFQQIATEIRSRGERLTR